MKKVRAHCPAPRCGGASLLELVATLAVLAVVLGLGVPQMAAWAQSSQLAGFSNTLLFDLYLARSEAIKRNVRVALCTSADGETCSGLGGWEQGLIVFQDTNQNAVRDPGEPVLHREAALPAGWRASGNQPVRRYVSFTPMGLTRLESGGFQAGTITLCRASEGPAEARQIVVNNGGRPRTQRVQVAVC
ncbi:GspH/FimT family pseudopilin [Ramlibacter humi]|uniref:Type II secretion system protein H n=1 Tax=Ramlibacter humi TaxID=2530451 RepID=A0A4Z0CAV2_9BURK|nr:GspH/FimT family pseudopilin [Ramlibacter humi]TFZ08723.1 type IV fimbrial biogenesis protein FimT [Ramlibacter humi]